MRLNHEPCVENKITKLWILQKDEKHNLEAGIQLVVQDRKVVAHFLTRKELNEARDEQRDGVKERKKTRHEHPAADIHFA